MFITILPTYVPPSWLFFTTPHRNAILRHYCLVRSYSYGLTFFLGVRVLLYPPFLIKTKMQVDRGQGSVSALGVVKTTVRREGARGLYKVSSSVVAHQGSSGIPPSLDRAQVCEGYGTSIFWYNGLPRGRRNTMRLVACVPIVWKVLTVYAVTEPGTDGNLRKRPV